jgi:hypothetical protein
LSLEAVGAGGGGSDIIVRELKMIRLERLRVTFAQIQDTMALAERQLMMAAQCLSAMNRERSSIQNLSEVSTVRLR